jgi:hypothetical protein
LPGSTRLSDSAFVRALPAEARRRLQKLDDQNQAAGEASAGCASRLWAARDALKRAQAKLAEMTSLPPGHPHRQPGATTPQYIPPGLTRDEAIEVSRRRVTGPLEDDLAAARDEVERLETEMTALQSKQSPLVQKILAWGSGLALNGQQLEAFTGRLKIPTGDPRRIIEDLRGELTKSRSRLNQISQAPFPAAYAKEIARRFVAEQSNKGIDTLRCLELGYPPVIPQTMLVPHGAVSFPDPDAVSIIFWLWPDLIAQRLCEDIDHLVEPDVEALTPDQRKRLEGEVLAETLQLERIEQAVISAAEEAGNPIPRRGDSDPRAVLQLSSALPAPRQY